MARRHGVWGAFHPPVRPSRFPALLRREVDLVIVAVWPVVLAFLVMRNFQLLEEDVRETFWPSASGCMLAYCKECQRLRVISKESASGTVIACTGGRLFNRHAEKRMDCFTSGEIGFCLISDSGGSGAG
jgi:hypothetical protein